ncbi:MAG: hypothetical protein KGY80_07055 [Candidatus Thorarchaeota archaeon]|nr:hypothetical protein [Candidatus Thorarchaeota archaeon]
MAELHVKWVQRPRFEYKVAIRVDFWAARKYHLKIGIITFLVLFAYGLVFWWITSIFQNAFQFLFLLSLNLLFGLIGARVYHLAGEVGGELIHILNPGRTSDVEKLRIEKTTLKKIHVIFEEANHHLNSLASGKRDDYRDLAWFLVITYSVLFLVISYMLRIEFWLIPINSVVFGGVFVTVYTNSYLTYPRMELIDGLAGLEYYVTATLDKIEEISNSEDGNPSVTWVQQYDDWMIYDFGFSFEEPSEDKLLGLYSLGFPKDANETFELRCVKSENLTDYRLPNEMCHAGWELEITVLDDHQRVYMHREKSHFDFEYPWKISVDPERIRADRSLLSSTISELLSKCKSE